MTTDELWSEFREIESLEKLLSKIDLLRGSERASRLRSNVMGQLQESSPIETGDDDLYTQLVSDTKAPDVCLRCDTLDSDLQRIYDRVFDLGMKYSKSKDQKLSEEILSVIGVKL